MKSITILTKFFHDEKTYSIDRQSMDREKKTRSECNIFLCNFVKFGANQMFSIV